MHSLFFYFILKFFFLIFNIFNSEQLVYEMHRVIEYTVFSIDLSIFVNTYNFSTRWGHLNTFIVFYSI